MAIYTYDAETDALYVLLGDDEPASNREARRPDQDSGPTDLDHRTLPSLRREAPPGERPPSPRDDDAPPSANGSWRGG